MIQKTIIPESLQLGMSPVEIVGDGSGLDKQAMLKRASAFDDVIGTLTPEPGKAYLHVITTGAMEWYQSNLNGDAFNEKAFEYFFPYPEQGGRKSRKLDGGLLKYHDDTYINGGAVYQEHKTVKNGGTASGKIVAAKYNPVMHRGELLICVDEDKWERRLDRKARGYDIYLSMGCSVPYDICSVCGHTAKTMAQHCQHFKRMKNVVLDDGTKCFVINDAPKFYDISGVDVPADKIAFVLRRVADGGTVKQAACEAGSKFGERGTAGLSKTARIIGKLAAMEKELHGIADDTCAPCVDEDRFLSLTAPYSSDEILDSCGRKGILLPPGLFFKVLAGDCEDPEDAGMLMSCGDDCCGDCSTLFSDLAASPEYEGIDVLPMGDSFSHSLPVDLSLDSMLDRFVPDMGLSTPVVRARIIRITIMPKKASKSTAGGVVNEALRPVYASYVASFAEKSDDDTCRNAIRMLSSVGK